MQGLSTPYSYIAAGAANQDSQVVKAAPTRLRGLSLHNPSAAIRYVKVYDKATGPTSADTPVMRFPLAASGGGLAREYNGAVPFANGLAFRITTGAADSDATAATANDVIVNFEYE